MTSPNRIAANRRNAKRSTGPRTQAGRSRVAQNALRHGLNANVDSALPDVESLTKRLMEENGAGDLVARLAAEAHAHLVRVMAVKEDMIAAAIQARHNQRVQGEPVDFDLLVSMALADCAPRLRVIDEYERKARSRRKKAFRALVE